MFFLGRKATVNSNGDENERSQEMQEKRKFCRCPRHRFFLFLLLLAVMLVLFNTNLVERTVGWTPTWFPYGHGSLTHRLIYLNSTGSHTNTTEPENSTVQDSIETDVKSTANTDTTATTMGVSSISVVKTTTAVLVPYVSPGPYHVEYPHEYHLIVDEPKKCPENKPFLVLMVPVAPHNRAARDAIRSTWGAESLVLGKAVSLFFLLALPSGEGAEKLQEQVLQESEEHGDLLQGDFLDSYKNLTIKTMVMLEWLGSRCPNASYAMKIDSDMFLNVHNLVKMLLTAPQRNYMTGLVAKWAAVLRDPNSKWYLPSTVYPESVYPPYALGLGYVMSLDLPRKLLEASRHIKAVYIEDVYVGLCMRHLGIQPTDPPEGNLFQVFPAPYNRCSYSRLITITTNDLINAWTDLHKPGPTC